MKRIILPMLAVTVAVFGIAAIASAQCADALQDGLEANVAIAQVGDTIEYTVTLWIEPSGNPCTLYHTTVYFHPPPDVQGAPCVDYLAATQLNLTPITVTPGTPITWTSADYPVLSQPVDAAWAGGTAWAYTCTRYVPDLAGANPPMPEPTSPLWSRDSAQTGVDIGCPDPCITITKEVDCDMSKVGDFVTYSICIENCGDFDLTDVAVYDDRLAALHGSPLAGFPTTLTPDQEVCLDFDYQILPSDDTGEDYPNATVVNQAYVMATDVCSDESVPTVYSDEVMVYLVHPDFEVTKVCVDDPVPSGQDYAEFDITITNTGDIDLDLTTTETEIPTITSLDRDEVYTHRVSRDCVDCAAANSISVTAWIAADVNECDLPNEIGPKDASDECECPCGGLEGCTPGYWGHPALREPICWCDRFDPGDMVSDIFDVPSSLMSSIGAETLEEAVTTPGGGGSVEGRANQLMFHGVAAMLNGCSDDVAYPMSADAVIDHVNAALATLDAGEINAAKNVLAGYNELGCPIDAHCRPIEDDEPEDKLLDANTGEISNPAE